MRSGILKASRRDRSKKTKKTSQPSRFLQVSNDEQLSGISLRGQTQERIKHTTYPPAREKERRKRERCRELQIRADVPSQPSGRSGHRRRPGPEDGLQDLGGGASPDPGHLEDPGHHHPVPRKHGDPGGHSPEKKIQSLKTLENEQFLNIIWVRGLTDFFASEIRSLPAEVHEVVEHRHGDRTRGVPLLPGPLGPSLQETPEGLGHPDHIPRKTGQKEWSDQRGRGETFFAYQGRRWV